MEWVKKLKYKSDSHSTPNQCSTGDDDRLIQEVARGELRVVIDSVFPLTEVIPAYELVLRRKPSVGFYFAPNQLQVRACFADRNPVLDSEQVAITNRVSPLVETASVIFAEVCNCGNMAVGFDRRH